MSEKLKLLANENFPAETVGALRELGYDVAWVRTDDPGSNDSEVLARAVAEDRVLVTFDKDFGELAFRHGIPASCGVILFRIQPRSPGHVTRKALAALGEHGGWAGHFSVVEEDRIRMTPLPSDS